MRVAIAVSLLAFGFIAGLTLGVSRHEAYADVAASCPAAVASDVNKRHLHHFGTKVVIDVDQITAYVHWADTTQVYLDGCGSFIYVHEGVEELTKIINGEKP